MLLLLPSGGDNEGGGDDGEEEACPAALELATGLGACTNCGCWYGCCGLTAMA